MTSDRLHLTSFISKISLEKGRNFPVTFCEFFFHFIFLFIIVGCFLSTTQLSFDSKIYSEFSLSVPPSSDDGYTKAPLSVFQEALNSALSIALKVPSFDQFVFASHYVSENLDASSRASYTQSSDGRLYTNLLYPGDLHFAPAGDEVNSLIQYLNSQTVEFASVTYYVHTSESDAVEYIMNNQDQPLLALIVLRDISVGSVNYVIRQNDTTLPDTNIIMKKNSRAFDVGYQQYLLSGFMTLQHAIDNWIWHYLEVSGACKPPDATLIPFPTKAYDQNPFYDSVGLFVGGFLVMSTIYPFSRLIKSIVEEKETRMKDLMLIMGLHSWTYHLGWFCYGFILFLWIALTCTAFTKTTFFAHSNSGLIFLFFLLFCMSEVSFAFFISSLFSQSTFASIAGPAVLFAALLPKFLFVDSHGNGSVSKILCCLLSPSAFTFGADIIVEYESRNVGIQLSNVLEGQFNFGQVLFMMWLDFFLYLLLCWIWLNVHLFDFRKSVDESSLKPCDNVEPFVDDQLTMLKVHIKNLTKVYPGGNRSLKNLSMDLLENEITCLLGPNGAGKSTLFGILTGSIRATSGEISIFGKQMPRDFSDIRRFTGICFQQDVLSPFLTVEEHLQWFGRIKGLWGKKLQFSINSILVEMDLIDQRSILSPILSKGSKRKLCLAIAFIGDPKFVLLDEPTAGLDCQTKKTIWSILVRQRLKRVILMTTHALDDAENIADRVVVISDGNLRCAGSPEFLRRKLDIGYNCKIHVDSLATRQSICSVVGENFPVLEIVPSGREIMVNIPVNSFSLIAGVLNQLENLSGVTNIKICSTDLAQVFKVVSNGAEAVQSDSDCSKVTDVEAVATSDLELGETRTQAITPCNSIHRFVELLRKRWIIAFRDWKGLFFQILFPALQIVLVLLVLTGSDNPAQQSLTLTTSIFADQFDVLPTVDLVGLRVEQSRYYFNYQGIEMLGGNDRNSSALSERILEAESLPEFYLGAFLYKDTIPVDGSVHVGWVREYLLLHPDVASLMMNNFSSALIDFVNVQYLTSPYTMAGSSPKQKVLSTLLRYTNGYVDENDLFDLLISNEIVTIDENNIVYYDASLESIDGLACSNNNVITLNCSMRVGVSERSISLSMDKTTFLEYLPDVSKDYVSQIHESPSIMHNTSSAHAMAALNGEYMEYFFRDCTSNEAAQYRVENHPLPLSHSKSTESKYVASIFLSVLVLIPFCYIPASFVSVIVRERTLKSKLLQSISGVSSVQYWVSTYLFDLFQFVAISGFIMAAFYCFQTSTAEPLVGSLNFAACLFVLLLTYGASAIPLSYFCSMLSNDHSTALVSVMALHFLTGFVAVLTYYLVFENPGTPIVKLLRIFPSFNLGEGLVALSTNYVRLSTGEEKSCFAWDITGRNIIFMAVESVGFFALVLVSELPWWKNLSQFIERRNVTLPDLEDKNRNDEIQCENNKIMELLKLTENLRPPGVILQNLTKIAPRSWLDLKVVKALDDLSLMIEVGEVLGIVGDNASGKSVLLGLLSSDINATFGSIMFNRSSDQVDQFIGFCPQVDPLMDKMTGRETLRFYGRIQGKSGKYLETRIEMLIEKLGLSVCADNVCETLSGGNKRKLTLAIALLGNPSVLLLDEPTVGVDPQSKLQIWDLIEEMSVGKCVLLVSHDVEEIQRLCSRIAELRNGKLNRLETLRILNQLFEKNEKIVLWCSTVDDVPLIMSKLTAALDESCVVEQCGVKVSVQLSKSSRLSSLLSVLGELPTMVHKFSMEQNSVCNLLVETDKGDTSV